MNHCIVSNKYYVKMYNVILKMCKDEKIVELFFFPPYNFLYYAHFFTKKKNDTYLKAENDYVYIRNINEIENNKIT